MSYLVPRSFGADDATDEIKPIKSLEMSLVSSVDLDGDLAGVFSNDSDETDEDLNPSMTKACEVVHSILDQVAWNDFPPTNEVATSKEDNFPRGRSRQCQVPPVSFHNVSHQNHYPSKLWNECYKSHCKPTEQKMGNVSLATLCARTLDTVGKPCKPTNVHQDSDETTLDLPRKPLSLVGSKKRDWGKSRKSNKSPPRFAEIVISTESTPTKKKDSRSFFGGTKGAGRKKSNLPRKMEEQENENPHSNPLQMFGSEYGRHVSSTVLAPKGLNASRGPSTFPRPHFQGKKNSHEIKTIEDAELSVLTGPITDILVTIGQQRPPQGYYRVSQSAGGTSVFLRDNRTPCFLNIKKETNWDRAAQRPCVTALALIFPQKQEFVPPGFSVVRAFSPLQKGSTDNREPSNLNVGGEQVFLCFRRSREGNPITALLPLVPSRSESVPEGFTVLEKTPRNHVAAIQSPSSQIFLAYRQRLANLEPLRPIPLVMAVHNTPSSSRKLDAYYSTGGVVVPSRVGRFHVMDRSTHSLLSPSSISNRLALIESSRRKILDQLSGTEGDIYSYSDDLTGNANSASEMIASSLLLSQGIGTPSNHSLGSSLNDLDFESSTGTNIPESEVVHRSASPCPSSSTNSSQMGASTTSETDFERCLEAMSFIPVVSTAVEETDPMAMLRFRARVAVLTPILTACYTRHGGSALLAVTGLLELLEKDFFSTDVNLDDGASSRITLLDIAVQVVCDVATTGAQETQMQACVEFVESAVRYGCGHLNTRTVGCVLRFYLFVFYFGMSTPPGGTSTSWGTLTGRDNFMLEDPRTKKLPYLPGGASQASALALKDLISFSIARLQSLVASERMLFRLNSPEKEGAIGPGFFDKLMDDVIDQSCHRVNIANYTQLAMHQVQRSGGSELFWYDMIGCCGSGLFGADEVLQHETRGMYSLVFALLANCVKVASTRIRKDKDSEGIPRDVASKLMSLEMLHYFLLKADEMDSAVMDIPKSHSFVTLVYAIRRLVVPCLLQNTSAAVDDPRIYRRILRIMGILWGSSTYRKYLKLELGMLFDQFVVRVLKLGPQILYQDQASGSEDPTYLFAQQIELLKTLQVWFSDPRGVLELFLNFGNDANLDDVCDEASQLFLSGRQWKIANGICGALCSVSEGCGNFIAKRADESNAMVSLHKKEDVEVLEGMSDTTLARESAKRLRKMSLSVIEQLVRTVAEAVGASKGRKFNTLIDGWGMRCNENYEIPLSISEETDELGFSNVNDRNGKDAGILGYWQQAIVRSEVEAVKTAKETEVEERGTDHVAIAFEIAKQKGLRKAVEYLNVCNILTASPRDIASFLQLHRSEVDPVSLGKYLGEAGSDASDSEYWNLIRFSYVRAMSFIGMTLDQALRHLLTNGGFKLPGEAQQVDRIVNTFAQCFWEDNAGDQNSCPFSDQDTVFLLSFAVIMLNTDLHKTISSSKAKNKGSMKRMTKVEFINNFRGVSVKASDISVAYLADIYDSIESQPIALEDSWTLEQTESLTEENQTDLTAFEKNATILDALLRGLSTNAYKCLSIEEFSEKSFFNGDLTAGTLFLTRQMFSQIWHEFHGLINSAVDIAHLDLEGLISCTSILQYCLALSICMDMPLERSGFLTQLGRIRVFHSIRRDGANADSSSLLDPATIDFTSEDWYSGIEEACTSNPSNLNMDKNRLLALKLVDELVLDMSLGVASEETTTKQEMKEAVRCLVNAEYLMNDPSRKFLRTGNLWKRSNRSGRLSEYRFFLFSDVLIYAKKSSKSSSFKIHEELPLLLMKVVDWFPPNLVKESKKGIQIYHPRKNVMIFCSSKEERGSWMSSLRAAIDQEVSRQLSMQKARKAAATTQAKIF